MFPIAVGISPFMTKLIILKPAKKAINIPARSANYTWGKLVCGDIHCVSKDGHFARKMLADMNSIVSL